MKYTSPVYHLPGPLSVPFKDRRTCCLCGLCPSNGARQALGAAQRQLRVPQILPTFRAVPRDWIGSMHASGPSHHTHRLKPRPVFQREPLPYLGSQEMATAGLTSPTLTVCSRMAGLVSRKPCTTWGKIWVLTVGSSRYWMNCSICGPGWGMRRWLHPHQSHRATLALGGPVQTLATR